MINKATDAVSKMTIKMNESDIVSFAAAARVMTRLYFNPPQCTPSKSFDCKWVDGVDLCLCQWFEEKLQEVESEDQQLRKLHVMVESLVNHRKGRFICFCSLWAASVLTHPIDIC